MTKVTLIEYNLKYFLLQIVHACIMVNNTHMEKPSTIQQMGLVTALLLFAPRTEPLPGTFPLVK